jgi:uncharacterized protein (DUF2336 family)
MTVAQSTISELELAIQGSSHDKRVDMLRRVTALFLGNAEAYQPEHVAVFDDVLNRLIGQIEQGALVELGLQLAPVNNAPTRVVARLAQHDDIAVAAPLLTQSPRLAIDDLVKIAQTQSQAHLLAMSKRTELAEPVTDILIDRGSSLVAQAVTDNLGARISDSGYANLVRRSASDESLAVKVGLRADIPADHFQRLLHTATAAAKSRLLAEAPPELAADIDRALVKVTREFVARPPAPIDYNGALRLATAMQIEGNLGDAEVLEFAKSRKLTETAAALSVLSFAPIKIVHRVLQGGRVGGILVLCKAASFSWPTVQAIINLAPAGSAASEETVRRDFLQLQRATAQRIIRFWKVRAAIGET